MIPLRRRLFFAIALVSALLAVALGIYRSPQAAQRKPAQALTAKYVFLFLADGAGINHLEITRQYSRAVHNDGVLIIDRIMKEGTLGLMTTHAADSLSTDSAASATALASGCKAKIGALGMCADGSVPKTAMEIAKSSGMRLGLVTNAAVYDASPAAFLSHVPNRRHYPAIVDRYLELEPDLLLGGGRDQFLPKGQPGSRRRDDTDVIAAFSRKGYRYVSTKQELEQVTAGRTLGLFNLREMSLELDRNKNTEPSVYDMTRTAIRLLRNDNPRGFFLFVETENIDTASHLTDVASVIHDYREFDRAVGLAYEFYQKHPRETLIIVTSDHDTGGLGFTMALRELSATRKSNQVAATTEDFRKIQSISISLRRASEILGPHPTAEAIENLMKEHFRGFALAPEIKEILLTRRPFSRTLYVDLNANALGLMIANNTQAYWQTATHTNQPVFVAAIGPGSEKFRGYQDNADFGKHLKAILQQEDVR